MRLVYLPEEDATVFAEVQSVAVLLPYWVVLLQREVHELPVHVVAPGKDQVIAELHTIDTDMIWSYCCVCACVCGVRECIFFPSLLYCNCFCKVNLSIIRGVITNKLYY